MKINFTFDEVYDDFFADTFYFVEATDFERLTLWETYEDKVSWRENTSGYAPCIAWLYDRPIHISFFYATINGRKIMFYWPCSQLVDHKIVEEFIDLLINRYNVPKDDGRAPETNAMNFHNCLHKIERANVKT